MKLYTAKISPFAAMCRIQIYSKKVDVELLELPDEASWDDISAISPIKKIPVLVDGDTVIPESQVICEYLEDKFPHPSLRPDDVEGLARMRLISRITDQYVMAPLLPLFAHLSKKHRVQSVVDQGLEKIFSGLASLEYFFADTGFAVSKEISLADCTLVPVLLFVEKYLPYFSVEKPFLEYKKLSRYWEAVKQDPVIAKVIEEIQYGMNEKAKG